MSITSLSEIGPWNNIIIFFDNSSKTNLYLVGGDLLFILGLASKRTHFSRGLHLADLFDELFMNFLTLLQCWIDKVTFGELGHLEGSKDAYFLFCILIFSFVFLELVDGNLHRG